MILVDEDGPLEKIPLWRFPVSRGNRHMFESLAAPVSRELDRHADQIGSTSSEVQYATRGDVDGDFARTIPGAVAEIAGQLGSEADVDPGRMLAAALEAMGEADGVSAAAASDASAGSVSLAVGGSEFEIVQWQIAGAGAPPPGRERAPRAGGWDRPGAGGARSR